MATIFAVLTLKPGVAVDDYERWVQETDVPNSASIPSITRYEVYRIGSDVAGGEAPYQYVEVIDITDIDQFRQDLQADGPQQAAAQFAEYVEGSFLLGERIA